MKGARLTLCLVILVSMLAEAKDSTPVQLTIYAKPQTVKELAAQTLADSGFSVSSGDDSQTVFVKGMSGRAGVLTYLLLSSSETCRSMAPRLFITLTFTATERGTVATISAQVEHTALVERKSEFTDTTFSECENVRDTPHFMNTRRLLRDVMEKIKTGAERADSPRRTRPETLLAGIIP